MSSPNVYKTNFSLTGVFISEVSYHDNGDIKSVKLRVDQVT